MYAVTGGGGQISTACSPGNGVGVTHEFFGYSKGVLSGRGSST